MGTDAVILCIGRELLKGTSLDRNGHFMAGRITAHGFRVRRILILDDDPDDIGDGIRHALSLKPRFVITTGGLGPSFDDMTERCVAQALGLPLALHAEALEMVRASYHRQLLRELVDSDEITAEREKMAFLPAGAVPLENSIGAAPGARIEHEGTTLILLPGVPEEMQALFEEHVIPLLREVGPSLIHLERDLDYPGKDESSLSVVVNQISKSHPGVYVKSRVRGAGRNLSIRITLYSEGRDEQEVQGRLDAAEADLRARLGLERTR
jgi:molybdenum cofactor synthesis domain-containing protein